jgi:hypothetical protein
VTRITDDDLMLVGLHKLAAERGDGLVPEMRGMMRHSRGTFDASAEIVQFPEPNLSTPPMRVARAVNENNVIAFPRGGRRAGER